MSVSQISALVAPPVPPHSSLDLPRRSANFHPNIWGDHFIQYISEPLEVDKKNGGADYNTEGKSEDDAGPCEREGLKALNSS
ncbi:hypothetical protein Lal_00028772 [Lupinus albus]|nr:hypothetical protein Lal_00028772 [Lupinus albus]